VASRAPRSTTSGHTSRELLPSDSLDDVMPWDLERPVDRQGTVLAFRVTVVESLFPVIRDFPGIIQNSKEAQAAIARSHIGKAKAVSIEVRCPSPGPPTFVAVASADPGPFVVPPPISGPSR
jgi:hypothetical protein